MLLPKTALHIYNLGIVLEQTVLPEDTILDQDTVQGVIPKAIKLIKSDG